MHRGLGIYKGEEKNRTNGWWLSVRQADGRRPKQYFKSAKERDAAFGKTVVSVRTLGVVEATAITPNERAAALEMRTLSNGTGFTPLELFHRGLAQISGGSAVRGTKVGDAIEVFLTEQDKRVEEKVIGLMRGRQLRQTLTRFRSKTGGMPLNECNRTVLKEYVSSIPGVLQTRANHGRVISRFFNWCVDEDLLVKNPTPSQETIHRIPAIFSNAEVAKLFGLAGAHFPELLPVLILQWYAGLRPGATHFLEWKHIDFEHHCIHIEPRFNKMKQPDLVQDLPLKVFELLKPFRKKTGVLAPVCHIPKVTDLHLLMGYSRKTEIWPADVARHTFASNLVAFYKRDMKRVEAVLLHKTSAMLKKHYLLKNVPFASAAEYFHFSPSA